MELGTPATAALGVLVAHFAPDGEPEDDPVVAAASDRVTGLLIDRLRTTPHGHHALTALSQDPDDAPRQADVHLAIRAALEQDPAFLRELTTALRLVRTVRLVVTGDEPEAAEALGEPYGEPVPDAPLPRRLGLVGIALVVLGTAIFSAAAATLTTIAVLR